MNAVLATGLFTLGGVLIGTTPSVMAQWLSTKEARTAREEASRTAVVAAYRDVLAEIDNVIRLQLSKRLMPERNSELADNREITSRQIEAIEYRFGCDELGVAGCRPDTITALIDALERLPAVLRESPGDLPVAVELQRRHLVTAMREDLDRRTRGHAGTASG